MMATSLTEKLGRLRRPEDDNLSLKARLEHLVAAAAARSRRRSPFGFEEVESDVAAGSRPRIEELVQGFRVENKRGEFFVMDECIHLDSRHGDVSLSRLRVVDPESVGVLTGEPHLGSLDFGHAVFLDTETTGLAGGTGTAAFLIGIGYVDGDRFRVRQYFMRDYHEEAALLAGLAADLRRFSHLVTFNGKMFDVPLLETRYRLSRDSFPLGKAPHLDLLHPARRLWKLRLESCSLQSLEGALLGFRRRGDVPGEEIPRLYFDYVRRRDARPLLRVFHHNRLDILSLAALSVLACQWVAEGRAEDPRDLFSLARVFERAQLHERASAEYRRALAGDPGPLRGPALMRLAARAKRDGDFEGAAALWREAAEVGEWRALRELAIDHEHRRRDRDSALEAVTRALAFFEGKHGSPRWLVEDLRHRRDRLRRNHARD